MKIENINLPHHITVEAKVYQKLEYILDSKYDKEFTGFCHAEKRENGEYHIYDIFFPRQDNAATTTECDSADVVALMAEGFDISRGAGHAHSHVDMQVFASSTDKDDIKERAQDSGFNAAIIVNKKGNIFGHIADMELGIYVEDCPVYFDYPFTDEEYEEKLLEEIKKTDDLKVIRKLANFSEYDYLQKFFPLSTEETEFLDEVIKTRFKNKYGGYQKKSTTPKNNIVKKIDYEDAWEKNDGEYFVPGVKDVPINPEDWFTTEEMAILEGSFHKSMAAMTDEEFRLNEELKAFFPNHMMF